MKRGEGQEDPCELCPFPLGPTCPRWPCSEPIAPGQGVGQATPNGKGRKSGRLKMEIAPQKGVKKRKYLK